MLRENTFDINNTSLQTGTVIFGPVTRKINSMRQEGPGHYTSKHFVN